MKKLISIVIPVFNEEKLVSNCLDSLAKQTYKNFEVIMVNNNSTDKTVNIAEKYHKKLNLKISNCLKQGRGAARAKGFSQSQAEIIFSTDADTQVPDNWIETMTESLEKNYIAVTGPNKISECSFLTNYIYNNFQPLFYFLYNLIFKNSTLNGFNFCVRKSAYLKSGGFSGLNCQEDLDLGFKLIKIGKIKFSNKIVVYSSGRRYKNGLIKGLLNPLITFFKYRLLKDDLVSLENVRN